MPAKIDIATRNGELIDASQELIRERLEAFADANRRFRRLDVVIDLVDPDRPVVEIEAPIGEEGLAGKAAGTSVIEAVEGATRCLREGLENRRTQEPAERGLGVVKIGGGVFAILLACVLSVPLLMDGCRSTKEPIYDIDGSITIDGRQLDDGSITFEDPQTGRAAGGKITDGRFAFPGLAGTYKVVVLPGTVMVQGSPDGPPSEEYIEGVVPGKYQSNESTDLAAEINAESTTFSFKLEN